MPNPVPGDLHVSGPLTDISVAYVMDQTRFIADQVFPNVSVTKQGDLYYKYDKGDWFRTDAQKRAPGAESVGTGWRVSTDSYYADVWALHVDVDDQTRANADSQFNLDRDATRRVTNDLLIRRDKEWISKFFGTGIWDTNITGVASGATGNQINQWNGASTTPIEDIFTQRMNMLEKTGFEPNVLVMGARVWQVLANHAQILERIKYTQAGFITEDLVARAFGVDRIIVAKATENTAVENKAGTTSFGFMAGKSVLLAYSAPNPGLMTPSAGYTFSWSGFNGSAGLGTRVKKFRIEERAADRVEGEMAFALKAVCTDLGCFYSGAVA